MKSSIHLDSLLTVGVCLITAVIWIAMSSQLNEMFSIITLFLVGIMVSGAGSWHVIFRSFQKFSGAYPAFSVPAVIAGFITI